MTFHACTECADLRTQLTALEQSNADLTAERNTLFTDNVCLRENVDEALAKVAWHERKVLSCVEEAAQTFHKELLADRDRYRTALEEIAELPFELHEIDGGGNVTTGTISKSRKIAQSALKDAEKEECRERGNLRKAIEEAK